ncbi:RING-H2 finger protein ATL63 [Gossypium australe]|uniref:RING-H2 finger protein ATL63 n=1 Tax=Gossypium australe TaxID=47621 RepID=A0A5B6VMB9_9ROSI|nr:RING-H2 finger protein ATL63 [Gossypium australe]
MMEDLNQHLKWFLQLCDTFKYNRVVDDVVRLQLFPFSLCDHTADWLDSLEPGSITTWHELVGKFLHNFPNKKIHSDNNLRSALDGTSGGALMYHTY